MSLCFRVYLLSSYSHFFTWTNENELTICCGQNNAANVSGKVALLSKTVLEPSCQLKSVAEIMGGGGLGAIALSNSMGLGNFS